MDGNHTKHIKITKQYINEINYLPDGFQISTLNKP